MNNPINFSDNPFLWIMNLVEEMIVHDCKFYFLLIPSVLLLLVAKKLLKKSGFIIQFPYQWLLLKLDEYSTKKALEATKKNADKNTQIKAATEKYINELSNPKNQYVAAQQLLAHPTPKGYCALIKFVVQQEHTDTRNDLFKSMYNNAKRSWHSTIV